MRYLIATLVTLMTITIGVYLGLGINKVIEAKTVKASYEELKEEIIDLREANRSVIHQNEMLNDILKNR